MHFNKVSIFSYNLLAASNSLLNFIVIVLSGSNQSIHLLKKQVATAILAIGEMDPKFVPVGKRDTLTFCPQMEKDENKMLENQNEKSHVLEKEGEASSMGLSVEENKGTSLVYKCNAKKHKFESTTIQGFEGQRKDKGRERRRLSRQERIELGRKFQEAVSIFNWVVARRLIVGVEMQILNDALCIALDSIWFLSSRHELNEITQLINLIISNGAHDFTRAVLRTSFLASCVSACKSSKKSSSDTQAIMAHR